VNKESYLHYIKQASLKGRQGLEQHIDGWRQRQNPNSFFGIYSGPEHVSVQAHIEGLLYHVTGNLEHAHYTKHCLLKMKELQVFFNPKDFLAHPEYAEGLPAAEPMFNLPYFLYGYLYIKDSGVLDTEENEVIQEMIRSSIRLLYHYPEWGAHNRCMLRVWALRLAIEAMEGDPITEEWDRLSRFMAEDTWGHWSIEDAEMYLAFWLKSAMEYAHYTGREDSFYALPQTRYYFDYIVHLLTPYGQIPDFGDAHFNSYWFLWAGILEKGAAVYRSGPMKYAAQKILEFGLRCSPEPSPGVARYFAMAYNWCDDDIKPVQPDWKSEEVMEDVIGKKIAFRSGWHEDDLYLLYNYRDEGDYAAVPRAYLRNTILVRAEKMHHGHADENAVSMLVKGQSILLNDGGYRETLPNGKYRADLYHNRLVFREGAAAEETSIYNSLHDDGAYKQVRTEKIHYQSFGPLDYSRTRVYLPHLDLTWDRCITFLKEDAVFIVVDWVQAHRGIELAIGNLWHTIVAESLAPTAFQTHIPHVYKGIGDKQPYINNDSYGLLIEYPGSTRDTGMEAIRRGYGDSTMVYEYEKKCFSAGEMNCYVTVLTPYKRGESSQSLLDRVHIERHLLHNEGIGLRFDGKHAAIHLSYKLQLELGLLEKDAYPRYTWEDGKRTYGIVTTDADFAYIREAGSEGRYGFINGSGIAREETMLFRTPQMSSYQFEKETWKFTDHKWKAWENVFPMKP
jgi:hypothetical protein